MLPEEPRPYNDPNKRNEGETALEWFDRWRKESQEVLRVWAGDDMFGEVLVRQEIREIREYLACNRWKPICPPMSSYVLNRLKRARRMVEHPKPIDPGHMTEEQEQQYFAAKRRESSSGGLVSISDMLRQINERASKEQEDT